MLVDETNKKRQKKGRAFDQAFRARKNALIVIDNLSKKIAESGDNAESQSCAIFKFVEELDKNSELEFLNDKARAENANNVGELKRLEALCVHYIRHSFNDMEAYIQVKGLDKSCDVKVQKMLADLEWHRNRLEKDDPKYDAVCPLIGSCKQVRTLWTSIMSLANPGADVQFPEGFECFAYYERYEKELNRLHAIKSTTFPVMWDELVMFYQQNKIDQCTNDTKYRELLMNCVSAVMLLVHTELRCIHPSIEFDNNVRMMKINGEYINNFNKFAMNELLKEVINSKKGISCCRAFNILTGEDITDELSKVERKKVLDAIGYINDQVAAVSGIQHDLLILIKGEYDEMICINPLLR